MTTICGHDRDALIWAIEYARDAWADNDTCVRELQAIDWRAKHRARFDALSAIIDPAKLAEMIAEEGRKFGFDMAAYSRRIEWLNTKTTDWATFQTWHYTCDNNTERGVSLHSRDEHGWDWTMPQARAILLQWLRLPDDAREEAERVLRCES